jgi:hypothetical protein
MIREDSAAWDALRPDAIVDVTTTTAEPVRGSAGAVAELIRVVRGEP